MIKNLKQNQNKWECNITQTGDSWKIYKVEVEFQCKSELLEGFMSQLIKQEISE